MDKDTQLWNQYESLREEIRGANSLNYQIIGVVVAAVAALLTHGFTQSDPVTRSFVFLCVYVVTIPGYRLLQGNRRQIWRTSTYIRVFLEEELDFVKWETHLETQAKKESTKYSFSSLVGTNEWFIISMMDVLAAIAVIFNGLLQISTTAQIQMGGIVIVIIFNLWLLIRTSRQEKDLRRLGKVETDFLKSWDAVKSAFEN